MPNRFDRDPAPPLARRTLHEVTVHGTTVSDDYAWMKAENWQEVLRDAALLPADIRRHIEAENAYADAVLAPLDDLRTTLKAEMKGRLVENEATVPEPDGPWAYFNRYRTGGQHPLLCRVARRGGPDEIMLDGDREAAGKPYFDLGGGEHSPGHERLAWSNDEGGSELYTILVRDLATGTDLPDRVTGTSGEVVWASDGRSFFYVEIDDNHRPVRVRRHRLGTDQSEDALCYEEHDSGWFVDLGRTASGRFLVIDIHGHEASESRLVALDAPDEPPLLVHPRTPLLIYDVDHDGERLVIRTNADGAEDFKLVTVPLDTPGREHWRDLVPGRPGIMVLSFRPFAGHLVRLERENANPRIVVRDTASGAEHAIAFAEEAYSLGLDRGYEFDTTTARFEYSSPATPTETWDYDLVTRERTLRKRQEVPSGFDPARYVVRRMFATARDGETVPVSLVHRRDLALDGSAPCLLYGYGSYGSSMPASFRTNLLSLVDRGFVYAVAHVRGGTEKGWRWYLDGKRDRKPNTFSDFIACADMLVEERFASAGRIVAFGGSAGGMLMGAVANLADGLFAGIVADVPFVDVLNTMLDGDLPLTPPEWPEWGDPGRDEAAFRTILAYSPYDNVRAKAYPAILALGGLSDPRVTYWEPAKWVAKLRATMTGGGPVLLRTNMEAGHGGAAGRFDRLDEVALIYAFAIAAAAGADNAPAPG